LAKCYKMLYVKCYDNTNYIKMLWKRSCSYVLNSQMNTWMRQHWKY
jgi:hypothetical protein